MKKKLWRYAKCYFKITKAKGNLVYAHKQIIT